MRWHRCHLYMEGREPPVHAAGAHVFLALCGYCLHTSCMRCAVLCFAVLSIDHYHIVCFPFVLLLAAGLPAYPMGPGQPCRQAAADDTPDPGQVCVQKVSAAQDQAGLALCVGVRQHMLPACGCGEHAWTGLSFSRMQNFPKSCPVQPVTVARAATHTVLYVALAQGL
jgi:hypothetical protein